ACLSLFFFSSRRRHTRLVSDWSSDVCSSDLHENNHSFMESPVMRVSLSPQFGRWQRQIAESLVPSSGRQMIGLLLDGKYRLEELCGRGGMGAVYRALHVGTGRRVAVKVIAPELAGEREIFESFPGGGQTIGEFG